MQNRFIVEYKSICEYDTDEGPIWVEYGVYDSSQEAYNAVMNSKLPTMTIMRVVLVIHEFAIRKEV